MLPMPPSENRPDNSIADAPRPGAIAVPPPSVAMLDPVMAETIGMTMHNAVSAQHNSQMLSSAAVTSTCARMLATPPPSSPGSVPVPPSAAGIAPVVSPPLISGAPAASAPRSSKP